MTHRLAKCFCWCFVLSVSGHDFVLAPPRGPLGESLLEARVHVSLKLVVFQLGTGSG